MEGGEVRWKDVEDKPILPLDDARAIFRDIVLGLEYRTWLLLESGINLQLLQIKRCR